MSNTSSLYKSDQLDELGNNLKVLHLYVTTLFTPFYDSDSKTGLGIGLPLFNLMHCGYNLYLLVNGLSSTAQEVFATTRRNQMDIVKNGLLGFIFNLANIFLNLINVLVSLINFFCRGVTTLLNGGYAKSQALRTITQSKSFFQGVLGIFSVPKNLAFSDEIKELDETLCNATMRDLKQKFNF